MAFGQLSPENGPYQAWATRLQQWSRDPTISLHGLPQLEANTFSRGTYMRLLEHVHDALAVFMRSWDAEAMKMFSYLGDRHSFANELIRVRKLLEPRLRLAQHPGWPQEIRESLRDGLRADLNDLQRQLEEGLASSSASGYVNSGVRDQLVDIVRRNSLTALMRDEVPIQNFQSSVPPQAAGPRVVSAPPAQPQSQPPKPARRILF